VVSAWGLGTQANLFIIPAGEVPSLSFFRRFEVFIPSNGLGKKTGGKEGEEGKKEKGESFEVDRVED